MTHRLLSLPGPWTALTVLTALMAVVPASAWGSTLVKFRLANEGTTPISRLDFRIEPPGSVVAPTDGTDPSTGQPTAGSPLTVLSDSTGFDTSKLSVALGSGANMQGLRLLFGQTQATAADGTITTSQMVDSAGKPVGLFDPGAILNFALNADPATANTLNLVLPEAARGLSLRRYATEEPNVTATPDPATPTTPPVTPSTGGVTDTTTVPEPTSVGLWGGAALAGLFGFRRRQAGRSQD